jgi:hypothetical protein
VEKQTETSGRTIPSADHLWQRVQELEAAAETACRAWEKVPSESLHNIRMAMRDLRRAADGRLPEMTIPIVRSDQASAPGGI